MNQPQKESISFDRLLPCTMVDTPHGPVCIRAELKCLYCGRRQTIRMPPSTVGRVDGEDVAGFFFIDEIVSQYEGWVWQMVRRGPEMEARPYMCCPDCAEKALVNLAHTAP